MDLDKQILREITDPLINGMIQNSERPHPYEDYYLNLIDEHKAEQLKNKLK